MPEKKGKIGRNVIALGLVSLFTDLSTEMIYPLLPVFLTAVLSAGPGYLGIIEGIAESTASLMKLASGWLSDRYKIRKPWVLAGYTISTVTRPLIAMALFPWHVLVARATDRVGKGVRTSPRDALISESTDADSKGKAFGFHRSMDHVGAILGPLAAFAILKVRPEDYRLVFWLALIPGAIAVAIIIFGVREKASVSGDVTEPEISITTPTSSWSPNFKGYLVTIIVFTLGNSSDAFLLLRAKDLGVAASMLPILWLTIHVVKATGSIPGGILSDKLGRKRVIIAGWIVYVLVYIGFGFSTDEWHAWALFAVYGVYFALTEAPEKALVSDLAGQETGLGTAFGAYHLAVGLSAFPSSLAFGLLWEKFGVHVAFSFGAGLAALATVLFAVLVREPEATK